MKESVWDYPRPPRVEPVPERLRVVDDGRLVADTVWGLRVLETSHPPTYYFPPDDVRLDLLAEVVGRSTFCEFKGRARYLALDGRVVAWTYPSPSPDYSELAGHVAFYPGRVDECWVGEERARAQEGDFYGGWITDRLVGPFKGRRGTAGW